MSIIDRGMTGVIEYLREFGEYRIDRVNNNLSYYGYAPKGSLDSDQAWIIQRESVSGGVTSKSIAPDIDNGYAKTLQKWDDRTLLFHADPWGNGYCTVFDGVNDYVNLGNNIGFERTDRFTFSFWCYFDNVTTAMTLFSKRSGSGAACKAGCGGTNAAVVFFVRLWLPNKGS
jgi:hypothetical protein